jgi:hypothetical protein
MGTSDAMLTQLGDERLGLGVLQPTKRPFQHVDVGINDVKYGGSLLRFLFGTLRRGIRHRGGKRKRDREQRRLHKTSPINRWPVVTAMGHVFLRLA